MPQYNDYIYSRKQFNKCFERPEEKLIWLGNANQYFYPWCYLSVRRAKFSTMLSLKILSKRNRWALSSI